MLDVHKSYTSPASAATSVTNSTVSPLLASELLAPPLIGKSVGKSMQQQQQDVRPAAMGPQATSTSSLDLAEGTYGISPSGSFMNADRSSAARPSASSPSKRKSPNLFKQLAGELRWMHHNMKHGYNSSCSTPRQYSAGRYADSSSSLPPASVFAGAEEDGKFATSGGRQSAKNISSGRNLGASAYSLQNKCTSASTQGTLEVPRWRTLENGEVERVVVAAQPRTTPDPFSPTACHYRIVHPNAAPLLRPMGSARAAAVDSGKSISRETSPASVFTMCVGRPQMSGSPVHSETSLSETENDEEYDEAAETGVNAVATVAACPADRCLHRARHSSDASVPVVPFSSQVSVAAAEDAYDAFLVGVAQMERQQHRLEQLTARLLQLYENEQHTRRRSERKGLHLSWTRTVDAANTVHYWRQKASLLRTFEAEYLDSVQHFHHSLQIIDVVDTHTAAVTVAAPARQGSGSVSKKAASAVARRRFLSSSCVLTAQQRHMQRLAQGLQACWTTHSTLREEARLFDLTEVRVPHDTFAVASVDAEHFIASLPPRISGVCLYGGVSVRTSAISLDSMDDAHTPAVLLTAQNLSPSSEEGDYMRNGSRSFDHPDEDEVVSVLQVNDKKTSSPLVSLISTSPAQSAVTDANAAATISPVTPKRIKCVIQSTTLDRGEMEGSSNRRSWNISNSTSWRTSPAPGSVSNADVLSSHTRRERHVTFALEPEVMDAQPRFSAQCRTIELLEQICLDKQPPWCGLGLLHDAVEAHKSRLAQLWEDVGVATDEEVLVRAITATPLSSPCCAVCNAEVICEACVPTPLLEQSSETPAYATAKPRHGRTKVKPKNCAPCVVM